MISCAPTKIKLRGGPRAVRAVPRTVRRHGRGAEINQNFVYAGSGDLFFVIIDRILTLRTPVGATFIFRTT